jgi:hypothetical protein
MIKKTLTDIQNATLFLKHNTFVTRQHYCGEQKFEFEVPISFKSTDYKNVVADHTGCHHEIVFCYQKQQFAASHCVHAPRGSYDCATKMGKCDPGPPHRKQQQQKTQAKKKVRTRSRRTKSEKQAKKSTQKQIEIIKKADRKQEKELSHALMAVPKQSDDLIRSQEFTSTPYYQKNSTDVYQLMEVLPADALYWCAKSRIPDVSGDVVKFSSPLYNTASLYSRGGLLKVKVSLRGLVPDLLSNMIVMVMYAPDISPEEDPKTMWETGMMRKKQGNVSIFDLRRGKVVHNTEINCNPTLVNWEGESPVPLGYIYVLTYGNLVQPNLAGTSTSNPVPYTGPVFECTYKPTIHFSFKSASSSFSRVVDSILDATNIATSWTLPNFKMQVVGQNNDIPYHMQILQGIPDLDFTDIFDGDAPTARSRMQAYQGPRGVAFTSRNKNMWYNPVMDRSGGTLLALYDVNSNVMVNLNGIPAVESSLESFPIGTVQNIGNMVLLGLEIAFPEFTPMWAFLGAAGNAFFGVPSAALTDEKAGANVFIDNALGTGTNKTESIQGSPKTPGLTGSYPRPSQEYDTFPNPFHALNYMVFPRAGYPGLDTNSPLYKETQAILALSSAFSFAPWFASSLVTGAPPGVESVFEMGSAGVEGISKPGQTMNAQMTLLKQRRRTPQMYARLMLASGCSNATPAVLAAEQCGIYELYYVNFSTATLSATYNGPFDTGAPDSNLRNYPYMLVLVKTSDYSGVLIDQITVGGSTFCNLKSTIANAGAPRFAIDSTNVLFDPADKAIIDEQLVNQGVDTTRPYVLISPSFLDPDNDDFFPREMRGIHFRVSSSFDIADITDPTKRLDMRLLSHLSPKSDGGVEPMYWPERLSSSFLYTLAPR